MAEVPIPMWEIGWHVDDAQGRLGTVLCSLSFALGRDRFALRRVGEPSKLRRVATMWGRSADRVEKLIANHEINVCTIGTERVVAGQSEIWTRLPPAVLSTHHPISEAGIEMRSRSNGSPRRRD